MTLPKQKKRILDLTPLRGLCNRLRAFDSALFLANKFDLSLRVHWYCDNELNCEFRNLFEPIEGVEVVEHGQATYRRTSETIPDCNIEAMKAEQWHKIFSNSCPPIESSFAFLGNRQFQDFVPCESIRQQLEDLHIDDNTLGIHIRRTDHVDAIAASPTDAFLAAMHWEIGENENTHFFVATDCQEEWETVQKAFPTRVMRSDEKTVCRLSTEGMQHAVVDLFALAACSGIIGSTHSSFSETAATIGGTVLRTVGEQIEAVEHSAEHSKTA